jgi:hypothetical protein
VSVVIRVLVGLYPSAFRREWGSDVEIEARAAGWRCWPNLLLGAVGLWLHPTVWPARSQVERRSRAADLAVAVTVCVWFLVHAATELDDPLNRWAPGSVAITGCAGLILLGLVLITPRPVVTVAAVIMVMRCAARQFAVPAGLGLGVVFSVHGGVHDVESSPLRPLLIAAWWFTLALGSVGVCRTFAGLDPDLVVPPSELRLWLGLAVLACAAILAGLTLLRFSLVTGVMDLPSAITGVGLLLLSAAFPTTLNDLRQLPSSSR